MCDHVCHVCVRRFAHADASSSEMLGLCGATSVGLGLATRERSSRVRLA